MISKGKWKDSSGKVMNPGKQLVLKLAAAAEIADVNRQLDEEGV